MNYPLCKALGVQIKRYFVESDGDRIGESPWYVPAKDLEAALNKAPVVTTYAYEEKGIWYAKPSSNPLHTARLVCVAPIVKDTAESLLRELIKTTTKAGDLDEISAELHDILRRARLLGGE